MREKFVLTPGIAGLALAASIFLGCQDFLSQDKPGQSAAPSAEDDLGTAQGASTQGTSDPEASDQKASTPVATSQADAEPAKDLPLTAAEPPKPVTSEPTTTPATSGSVAECQAIYDQMQSAKDPLYGELKNKFGSLNCDFSKIVVPTVPFVPPDSETVCKSLRSTLATMDPNSEKYASYLREIAVYCKDAKSPASPVATPSIPAISGDLAECQAIYDQMQAAIEPLYGELKNKFGSLNCDLSKVKSSVPFVPPDSATICKNIKASLAQMDPSSPKYPMYQKDLETYCPGNP